MGFFRKTLRKEHLLDRGIYSDSKGHLAQRIDYAWNIYNSPKPKYTTAHKDAALSFLRASFNIPESYKKEQAVEKIAALMALKAANPDKKFVPKLPDPVRREVVAGGTPSVAVRVAEIRAPVEEVVRLEPMAKLKYITSPSTSHLSKSTAQMVDKFIKSVNGDIDELNRLIKVYNDTRDKEGKIRALQGVYHYAKIVDSKYQAAYMSFSAGYRETIHQTLYSNVKKEFAKLGILSLHKVLEINPASPPITPVNKDSFAEILANMSPEKTSRLLTILAEGAKFDLTDFKRLYSSGEEGYEEFQSFLKKHSIQFLGGGNSKNFKITSLADGSEIVLKVDNRLNMPKKVEAHLREHSLKATLTPVAAERQATYVDASSSERWTRTLLLTEFCAGGDLESHSKQRPNNAARLQSALDIYSQMGTILNDISRDGCGFPDMKNTNWLLDRNGRVRLADTKSFAFTDAVGNIDYKSPANEWCSLLSTGYMNPPEFKRWDRVPFSADKMHSFMLGKNLYQYLTQCDFEYLYGKNDAAEFDFSAPIFQSAPGRQLKTLISAMIKVDPAQRIPVSEAVSELTRIQKIIAVNECNEILEKINRKGFGKADTAMNAFVMAKQAEILEAKNLAEVGKIKDELNAFEQVKVDPQLIGLREALVSSGDRNAVIALNQIPVKERGNIMAATSPEALVAKELIVVHRYKSECKRVLATIAHEELGPNDVAMRDFIEKKKRAIAETSDPDVLLKLKTELTSTLEQLKKDSSVKEVKSIIQDFRKNAGLLTVGMNAKATRIEDALMRVPIEERRNLHISKNPAAVEVQKAIASHRYWGKRGEVYLNKDGTVDEKKAANSFKDFKARLNAAKDSPAEETPAVRMKT